MSDSSNIPRSEITPHSAYLNRRAFMAGAAALGVAAIAGERAWRMFSPREAAAAGAKLPSVRSSLSLEGVQPTAYQYITGYNNFYEFGTEKDDPARNAGKLQTRPWSVQIEGLVKQPKTFDIDTLLKLSRQEERIYRFRCVEGWSMVIPWIGYSLSELIKQVQPLPNAKYVQFISALDKRTMNGLSYSIVNFPYSEGLRMDEAMHPLTLLTFGLYGEVLPNQDGAPVRLIVPWKYGFKSAKSIVKIRFVDKQPRTTWNDQNSQEYGFYSNVNPQVDHPRWSQKTERVIGAPIWKQRQPTLAFNGYGSQVASLYAGMDLRKYF